MRRIEAARDPKQEELADLSNLRLGPTLPENWARLAGLLSGLGQVSANWGWIGTILPTCRSRDGGPSARLSQLRTVAFDENRLTEIPDEGWKALGGLGTSYMGDR